MALYEILPALRERTHKYRVQISNDPVSGLQRFVDVHELAIGGFSIRLSCDVDYVDSEGEVINTERIKSYNHTLYASKDGPWVNPQTGTRTEPEYNEDREITNGVITRYAYLMQFFKTRNLPFSVEELEVQFIANADSTLKEFDK